MTEPAFNPGDQVILQSGGPYMTVDTVINGQVSCVWFVGNEIHRGVFGEALLKSRDEFVAHRVGRRKSIVSRSDGF